MTGTAVEAREILITRVYEAPRELVWKAWTEPERLAQWWGKRGWQARPESVVIDLRPGGLFSVTTVSAADGSEMTNLGTYREIVEPERIVWEGDGTDASVTFADLGDGRTEMTFHTVIHTTAETAAAAKGGLSSAFERLAELLGIQSQPQRSNQ